MLFQLFFVSFVVLLHILSNNLSVNIALAPRSHCEANSHKWPKGIPKVKRDMLNVLTLIDFSLVNMNERRIMKF